MRKDIKKLYKGKIELRDYDVQSCITKNENMTIIHDGEKMTLTPEDLVEKKVSISPMFHSKIDGGKSYKLYGYNWEPDEIEL